MNMSKFPKWLLDHEDSYELIGKAFRNAEMPDDADIEKTFDSVFVVVCEYEKEKDDEAKNEVEFKGFDTGKELLEFLRNDDSKIHLVYHTRKQIELDWDFEVKVWPKGQTKTEEKCEADVPGTGKASPPPFPFRPI